MKKDFNCFYLCSAIVILASCDYSDQRAPKVNDGVHAFYYSWFGNPEVDGQYNNWNHQIIPHWVDTTWNDAGSYPGGDDIGANFYPQLGSYSSNDITVINKHMQQIREAGIGVLAFSWWGKGHFSDKSVKKYLDIADTHGLKIAFVRENNLFIKDLKFSRLSPVFKPVLARSRDVYGESSNW